MGDAGGAQWGVLHGDAASLLPPSPTPSWLVKATKSGVPSPAGGGGTHTGLRALLTVKNPLPPPPGLPWMCRNCLQTAPALQRMRLEPAISCCVPLGGSEHFTQSRSRFCPSPEQLEGQHPLPRAAGDFGIPQSPSEPSSHEHSGDASAERSRRRLCQAGAL